MPYTTEEAVEILAWLHAELEWRHDQLAEDHAALIKQLQAIIDQMIGKPNDPVRADMLRRRATNYARIKAANATRR